MFLFRKYLRNESVSETKVKVVFVFFKKMPETKLF